MNPESSAASARPESSGWMGRVFGRLRRAVTPFEARIRVARIRRMHPWLDQVEDRLTAWFVAHPARSSATGPEVDVQQRVHSCMRSFCSPEAFAFVDRVARILCEAAGERDLSRQSVALQGCDWGFGAIHLARSWRPASLVAVDVTGRFADVGRSVAEENSHQPGLAGLTILRAVPRAGGLAGEEVPREHARLLIVTKSVRVAGEEAGRETLLRASEVLQVGGHAIFYPTLVESDRESEGLDDLLSACGYDSVAALDAHGKPTSTDAAFFFVARKARHVEPSNPVEPATAPALPEQRSRSVEPSSVEPLPGEVRDDSKDVSLPNESSPQRDPEWMERGQELIRSWFEESEYYSRYVGEADQASELIDGTVHSYCSPGVFRMVDRMVQILADDVDVKSLDRKRVLVFGCDWGFNVIHLRERWNAEEAIGVDLNGKYSDAARVLAHEHADRFAGKVRFLHKGPWGLRELKASIDHLVITNSMLLLDDQVNRVELFQMTEVLRPRGVLLYYPPRTTGALDLSTYPSLLEACGLVDVRFMTSSGAVLDDADDPSVYFIRAEKERVVTRSEFESRLAEIGQDADSLLQKRAPIEDSHRHALDRMEAITGEIRDGKATLSTLPVSYTLNVISVCNIKCIFCDYPDMLRHWTLPDTFLGDILDTLDGAHRIQITGGEPLLNRTAMRLIERVGETPDTLLDIISNMTLPPKRETLEKIAQGASFLTCSIDAATKETYDVIRQDSDWDRVFENLKLLSAIKKERGTAHPFLEVNFIITGLNVHEIADFVDRAREVSADSVSYKWLFWTKTPRITEEARVDHENDEVMHLLCKQLIEARRRAHEYGIRLSWGPLRYHIRELRPDLFDEYGLDAILDIEATRDVEIASYGVFDEARRPGTASPTREIDRPVSETVREFDMMPDGLMPCVAPFALMQVNHPRFANFCCYSVERYRSIPIDSSGSLRDAWNSPLFVEAREHFLKGEYEKVCQPNCFLYMQYEKRRQRQSNVE